MERCIFSIPFYVSFFIVIFEAGRFISQDGVEYLDPERINGLNLYAYCGNNPVMNVDPNGNDFWSWLLGALVVVAVTIATAGVATGVALAFGATIATATVVMGGAIAGGLIVGGTNLVKQGITTNWQTVDYSSLALSTFIGGSSGAISSGFGLLSAGVASGTRLLAHRGFHVAVNVILSCGGYMFSSTIGGKEETLDGIIFATLSGFISGLTFNWGTIPTLGLLIGLEFISYTRDIIDYIRNSFKNAQRINGSVN